MLFPFLTLTLAATAVAASASHQIRAANTSACPVSSVPAAANYTGTTHNKGTQTVFVSVMAEVRPLLYYFNILLCALS